MSKRNAKRRGIFTGSKRHPGIVTHAIKFAGPTKDQIGAYNGNQCMENAWIAEYQTGPRRGQQLATTNP